MLGEEEDLTWGDFAGVIDALESAYGELSPPQELQDYHDASLRSYQALRERARTRPSEDSFIEEFLGVALEIFGAALEIGLDTTKTDAEKEQLIEARANELFAELLGPDFVAASQAVDEARDALPEETLALLDDAGCYSDILEEDHEEAVAPVPTVTAADTDDDHGDSIEDATTVAVGEFVQGSVDFDGDEDFFVFEAEEGVLYQIDVELGTLEDSYLFLLNSDGRELRFNDDHGDSPASRIVWRAPASEDSYLRVSSDWRRRTGSYTLTVAVSDIDDHADDIDGATTATVGEVIQGTVDFNGDQDFFVFQAEEGAVYRIDVALGTLPTSGLELYDPDGQRMGRGNWEDSGAWIIWKAPITGQHFVKVLAGAWQTDSIGTYTLTVSQSDITDDHGDDIESATPLTVGETVAGAIDYFVSHAFGVFDGEEDYFVFQAEEGEVYRIELALGTLDSSWLKLGDDGDWWEILEEVRNHGDSQASQIVWEAPNSGEYYVIVTDSCTPFVCIGSYTLTVDLSGTDDDLGSSALTQLTDNSALDWGPAWSPDGGGIAFSSDRDGDFEIYVMNTDGSGVTRLTDDSASDEAPAWSPDGSRIAFHSDRDGDHEIYVMNADGSGTIQLTSNSAEDRYPAWSPDGSRVAFHSDRDGDYEIHVVNADGSSVIQLTDNSYDDWRAAWSPDGIRVAFASDRDGDDEIYVMSADGSGVVQLTDNSYADGAPAWSPDGGRIAFHSDHDGDYEIYAMSADGSGVVQLTYNLSYADVLPAWSPDGSSIAFHSDRDGDYEIYVMAITPEAEAATPTPTPTPTAAPALATVVMIGMAASGNLDNADDKDFFVFGAKEDVLYQIDTELGTLYDSVLRLVDSDGRDLAYNDDHGDSLASRMGSRHVPL